jgi:KUP system potassium uptake protein
MQAQQALLSKALALLSLTSLGIVYGDIGTSPLYAFRECFSEGHSSIAVNEGSILGVLSLIFWSLTLIIGIKYIVFVMRADNNGEGGTLALGALCTKFQTSNVRTKRIIMALALFGAALMIGDGMITPAISVLSALEGLKVATPVFKPFIIPLTIIILVFLFYGQSRGTDKIGRIFGPIMLLWFFYLSVLGVKGISLDPTVLKAVNPIYAINYLSENGFAAFKSLGAVFLVVTGGEALYADMGHFGHKPIRFTWLAIVFPALLLTYFGQGALLIHRPEAISNPFYELVPRTLLYPTILLAAAATVIASQAVISGVFSLASQAIQLGYSPRFVVHHTSSQQIGQVYLPHVNFMMMTATIFLVLGFKSSSDLAAAYGVAVSLTMVLTVLLISFLAWKHWKWKPSSVLLFLCTFLAIDLAFLGANLVKFTEGGWFPLVLAIGLFTLMTTWRKGRRLLAVMIKKQTIAVGELEALMAETSAVTVPGAAVFMTGNSEGLPPALVHNLRHNKVIHQKNIFVTIKTAPSPFVPSAEQVVVNRSNKNFDRIIVTTGFREFPDVTMIMERYEEVLGKSLDDITFFIGRETLISTKDFGLSEWQAQLFIFMSRNAQRATQYFGIPPDNVVEIGMQLKI